MATLVFLEHHGDELLKPSLGVLSKATTLDEDVTGVVLGSGVKELASEAGKFGASKVVVVDAPELEAPLPQPRVDALASIVGEGGYDTVLFAASVLAADVAAGLSARLQAGLNWDLTDLVRQDGELVGKRPALGDSVLVDVGWTSEPRLALIRAGTFDPQETGGEAQVEEASAQFEDFSTAAAMVEQAHAESEGPSIEDADVIVAGGRGLGSPENFKLVEELAQALGGAVAATRAVVAPVVSVSARSVRPQDVSRSSPSPSGSPDDPHKVGMRTRACMRSTRIERPILILGSRCRRRPNEIVPS